jgi:hypothetical protein
VSVCVRKEARYFLCVRGCVRFLDFRPARRLRKLGQIRTCSNVATSLGGLSDLFTP